MAELQQVRFWRKCTALVVTALLCFSMVPMRAFADEPASSCDKLMLATPEEVDAAADEAVLLSDSAETSPGVLELAENACMPSPESDEGDAVEEDASSDADEVVTSLPGEEALGRQSERPVAQPALGFVYIHLRPAVFRALFLRCPRSQLC